MLINFHTDSISCNYVSSSSSGMTSEIMAVGLGPLNISSTATKITMSWVPPHLPLTHYVLTSVCALLCNGTPFPHATSTPGPSDTSANITGLFPGTVCDINLTAYNGTHDYLPTITQVTTKSESELSAKYLI